MGYNVSFVGGDIFVGGSKVECFVKEILANGQIEFFDIKANEVRVLPFESFYIYIYIYILYMYIYILYMYIYMCIYIIEELGAKVA